MTAPDKRDKGRAQPGGRTSGWAGLTRKRSEAAFHPALRGCGRGACMVGGSWFRGRLGWAVAVAAAVLVLVLVNVTDVRVAHASMVLGPAGAAGLLAVRPVGRVHLAGAWCGPRNVAARAGLGARCDRSRGRGLRGRRSASGYPRRVPRGALPPGGGGASAGRPAGGAMPGAGATPASSAREARRWDASGC